MKTWIVLALAVAVPWIMTTSAVGLTVAGVSGCDLFETNCDKIKKDCRDKGGEPKNCKEEQTINSDSCECECVYEE